MLKQLIGFLIEMMFSYDEKIFYPASFSDEGVFAETQQLMTAVHCKHIITPVGFSQTTHGHTVLVMEFASCGTLEDLIADKTLKWTDDLTFR